MGVLVNALFSGGFALCLHRGCAPRPHWGTSVPQTPFVPSEAKSWLRPCPVKYYDDCSLVFKGTDLDYFRPLGVASPYAYKVLMLHIRGDFLDL